MVEVEMNEVDKTIGNNNSEHDYMEELTYEEKLSFVSEIAQPIAGKKLTKKLYKLVKKASKEKKHFVNGLRDVQKALRRDEKGIVIFAGNISPIDVMIHLPAVCESKDIPYCFVPSRFDLGKAMGVRRGTLMVLVKKSDSYKDSFNECLSEISQLPPPY